MIASYTSIPLGTKCPVSPPAPVQAPSKAAQDLFHLVKAQIVEKCTVLH